MNDEGSSVFAVLLVNNKPPTFCIVTA